MRAGVASFYAAQGRHQEAMKLVEEVLPAIERGEGFQMNYTAMICLVCDTVWQRGEKHDLPLERHLVSKTLEPDFRYPHMDGRLAMARLCALDARYREARGWFSQARGVLEEQGARPLRAIVDYDEATMYARRGGRGDRARAEGLMAKATIQFRKLGMTGWVERAMRECAPSS